MEVKAEPILNHLRFCVHELHKNISQMHVTRIVKRYSVNGFFTDDGFAWHAPWELAALLFSYAIACLHFLMPWHLLCKRAQGSEPFVYYSVPCTVDLSMLIVMVAAERMLNDGREAVRGLTLGYFVDASPYLTFGNSSVKPTRYIFYRSPCKLKHCAAYFFKKGSFG